MTPITGGTVILKPEVNRFSINILVSSKGYTGYVINS